MKLLTVYGGFFAEVDDDDFERLSKFKWHISKRSNGYFYVVRSERLNPKRSIKHYLHREVLMAKKGQIIDHKDRNVLNNKKENLRFCTQSENLMNRKRPQGCMFKFRGVSMDGNRFLARIKKNGIQISLGGYHTQEEAALAYNKAAVKIHGEFAFLNCV